MDLFLHIRHTNFMGFREVLANLRAIYRIFHNVVKDINAYQPDALLLVDYPGFNLRLAKKFGETVPVYYYISPQLWAWKKGRVKIIRRYVRKLIVILPFEVAFYQNEGVEVDYVGHPLLDALPPGPEPLTVINDKKAILALLPGSRRQEIKRMTPIMLEAAARFTKFYTPKVAVAPTASPLLFENYLNQTGFNPDVLVMNDTYSLLRAASVALVTSGTATLETALLGVPQAVCYKGDRISFEIAKRIVKVPYISLVNLIMEQEIVPEFIQTQLTVGNLVSFLETIENRREEILNGYRNLQEKLGGPGASLRAAELLEKYTNEV